MTDDELIKIAWDVRTEVVYGSSRGHCILVSSLIQERLMKAGIKCRISQGNVGNEGHLWVTLEDGRILDGTGDQFDFYAFRLTPIYLGKKPDWYEESL
jgi:hypothetical protein